MSQINNTFSSKEVKNIFFKHDALDKSHTIDRNTLFRELEGIENGKQILNQLQFHQIVRKSNNRYYFCGEAETNKQYRIRLLALKISIASIILICIIAGIVLLIFSNKTSKNNSNNSEVENTTSQNSSTLQEESELSTYSLKDFNIQIQIPSDMQIALNEEIDYLFGNDSSDFYEFVIYNNSRIVSCFIKDTNKDEVDTYWKNVQKTYSEDTNYEIISDIKEETISGFTFTTFEAQSESNKEIIFGYFKNGKFVSFQYTYPVNESNSRKFLNTIIKDLN